MFEEMDMPVTFFAPSRPAKPAKKKAAAVSRRSLDISGVFRTQPSSVSSRLLKTSARMVQIAPDNR
jgi:hypothetical protein